MKTSEHYKIKNLTISVVLEGNSVWTIEMLKHQIHPFVEYIASFVPFFQVIYGNEKALELNFSSQNELIEYSMKLADKEAELHKAVKDSLGDIANKIEIKERELENDR